MVIPTYRELGVPLEKVNLFGGAIALGHPFGMSGCPHHRNADSWIALSGWALRTSDDVRGGGQGMAMVVELFG
jgi:acetyl-CoA C-acetyltransferase